MYNYEIQEIYKQFQKQSRHYCTTDGCTFSSPLHVPEHIPHTRVQSLLRKKIARSSKYQLTGMLLASLTVVKLPLPRAL